MVLNGITGALGLTSTLAALEAGRMLALANKESLIVGGPLVKRLAGPGQIIPVDSEHSALAQCLRRPGGADPAACGGWCVTASGGPFRGRSAGRADGRDPREALNHPTWNMGPVITMNSATLVNKGLEVIEAHLLFDIGFDRIEVVVHPQSMIHSMVEFADGSTIAQASPPDMRLPIALALACPDRVPGAAPGGRLDHGPHLDLRAARRRGVPVGRAGPSRGRPGRHGAGGLQRGERGVRGGVPARALCRSSASWTRWSAWWPPTPPARRRPSRRSSRRTPGRGRGRPSSRPERILGATRVRRAAPRPVGSGREQVGVGVLLLDPLARKPNVVEAPALTLPL